MRFASACLVSLVVAYTCFGQSDEPAPAAPKTACPLSAGPQSACSKSACSKPAAYPTASACPQASHCPSSSVTACAEATACTKAGECSTKTVCKPSRAESLSISEWMNLGSTSQTEPDASACESNSACANETGCESITDCAASRVAARAALAHKLAACQTRATTDTIARHPELLGISVSVATPTCADSADACATTAEARAAKQCATKTSATASCETGACETATCETTACESTSCDKSACCKTACDKSECCQAETTAVAIDDTRTPGMRKCFELNSREATMVTSAERLDHLQQAAEHLVAAGCENEAACVTAWATEMKQDLAAHMCEMSEVLREAAGELEEELKTAGTNETAATACQSAASNCKSTAPPESACDKTATCPSAPATSFAVASEIRDLTPLSMVQVQVLEVNLSSMRRLGLSFPGCASSQNDPGAASVCMARPEVIHSTMTTLLDKAAARIIDLPQVRFQKLDWSKPHRFELRHSETGSHLEVTTTNLDGGRTQVAIHPCPGDAPADEAAASARAIYEVDAEFEIEPGKVAIVGGHVDTRVRVEKRGSATSVTVHTREEQVQTLFIVGCIAAPPSKVAPVSHNEPSADDGASVCPTACDKAVLKTAAKKSCETSACQRKSSCPTANCPTAATNCDSAHTPACHAATGVAASTCPLTSDVQLLTACEAAKACAAKTGTATACQQKSCDTQTATACSKASSCPATAACQAAACPTATACEKKLACDASAYLSTFKRDKSQCEKTQCEITQCDQTGACPTAVASGNSLVRPATPFLAEAVATDAPAACASSAAACCERNKSCTAAACCRQGEAAAMANISDEPCATEDSANAPCAGAVCTDLPGVSVNSDAGCIGVIACDSGVEATAMPVATGSYLEMHLAHLTKAAVHLTEAGLAKEAASVNTLADQLRRELIATKHAQIASLKAEIAALRADCDAVCLAISTDSAAAVPVCRPAACAEPECNSPIAVPVLPAPRIKATQAHGAKANKQILLKVKIVEVSMNQLKKLGFEIATPSGGAAASGDGFHSFLEALERENVAKVLAEPSLVLADRRPASYHVGGSVNLPKPGGKPGECTSHEIGTRLDAVAVMLDDRRVRIDIRPRVAELETSGDHGPGICVREIDTGFETELGKTVVLGGLLQEQVRMKKDPETLAERTVHDQRQTFFLVTPCAMEVDSAVQPVSHAEPVAR